MKQYKINSLFLLLLFIVSLVGGCSDSKTSFPLEVGDLVLAEVWQGDEAKRLIFSLHNKDVAASKNLIGFYKAQNNSATVYVSFFKSTQQARSNIKSMISLINKKRDLFTGLKEGLMHKISVFSFKSIDQTNYVFNLSSRLYWISVDKEKSNKFLEKFLSLIES